MMEFDARAAGCFQILLGRARAWRGGSPQAACPHPASPPGPASAVEGQRSAARLFTATMPEVQFVPNLMKPRMPIEWSIWTILLAQAPAAVGCGNPPGVSWLGPAKLKYDPSALKPDPVGSGAISPH